MGATLRLAADAGADHVDDSTNAKSAVLAHSFCLFDDLDQVRFRITGKSTLAVEFGPLREGARGPISAQCGKGATVSGTGTSSVTSLASFQPVLEVPARHRPLAAGRPPARPRVRRRTPRAGRLGRNGRDARRAAVTGPRPYDASTSVSGRAGTSSPRPQLCVALMASGVSRSDGGTGTPRREATGRTACWPGR